MPTLSLGWSIDGIDPAVDRCCRLCTLYANDSNGAFPSGELTRQLKELKSAHQGLKHQPNVGKIYINLEAVTKTLEQCQVFLNQHRASLLQTRTEVEIARNAALIKRLKLHTQMLEVYHVLLKR